MTALASAWPYLIGYRQQGRWFGMTRHQDPPEVGSDDRPTSWLLQFLRRFSLGLVLGVLAASSGRVPRQHPVSGGGVLLLGLFCFSWSCFLLNSNNSAYFALSWLFSLFFILILRAFLSFESLPEQTF